MNISLRLISWQELPDPHKDERILSLPVDRWGSEATIKRFYGLKKSGGTWVEDPTYPEPASAVFVVPGRLTFEVLVEGTLEKPIVWLMRLPNWDIVLHPTWSFSRAQLFKPELDWDPERKAWVGRVEVTVKDPGATRVAANNAGARSLLRNGAVVFAAVAVWPGDPLKTDMDWLRVRALPPKFDPSATALALELACAVTERALSVFGDELMTMLLPEGQAWEEFLQKHELPRVPRDLAVRAGLEALKKDMPTFVRSAASLLGKETVSKAIERSKSWLDLFQSIGRPMVELALLMSFGVGLEGLVSGSIRPRPQGLMEWLVDATRWIRARIEEGVKALADAFRWVMDPLTGNLYAERTSEAPDWKGDLLELLETTRLSQTRELRPVLYFETQVDPDEPYGRDGVVSWFVALRNVGGRYVPTAYAFWKEEEGVVLEEIDPAKIVDDHFLRNVQEGIKTVQNMIASGELPQSPPSGSRPQVPPALSELFSTVLSLSVGVAGAQLFPDHVAQSDLWSLKMGYSPWSNLSVYSLLRGSALPPLSANLLIAAREAARHFLDLDEQLWSSYFQAAEEALEHANAMAQALLSTSRTPPAEDVFNTFLLTLSAHQYQFYRWNPVDLMGSIPYAIGWAKILRLTNLDDLLVHWGKDTYLGTRDALWQLYWPNIVELELGKPMYISDIMDALYRGLLRVRAGEELPQPIRELAELVLTCPDKDRMPAAVQLAQTLLAQPRQPSLSERMDAAARLAKNTLVSVAGTIVAVPELFSALWQGFEERARPYLMATAHLFQLDPEAYLQEAKRTLPSLLSIWANSLSPEETKGALERLMWFYSDDPVRVALYFQEQATSNPVRVAYLLGKELGNYTLYFSLSAPDFLAAVESGLEAFLKEVEEGRLSLRDFRIYPAESITEESAREALKSIYPVFKTEFLRSLANMAVAMQATVSPLPRAEDPGEVALLLKTRASKTISGLMTRAFQRAIEATRKQVSKPSIDLDNLAVLAYYYLFGWLALDPNTWDEDWVAAKFGEVSPFFPFFGRWGHVEQRLVFVRLGLSLVSGTVALVTGLLSNLLGR